MKIEEVRALGDSELAAFIAAGQEEQKARAEKRRQEAIARIKEIAAREHITVNINGQRGRPAGVKSQLKEGANGKQLL